MWYTVFRFRPRIAWFCVVGLHEVSSIELCAVLSMRFCAVCSMRVRAVWGQKCIQSRGRARIAVQ